MANLEHVKVVKQGRDAIAKWRLEHPRERLDLSRADLVGANLSWADLSDTIIATNLAGITRDRISVIASPMFTGTNLSFANLQAANLRWTNLHGALMNAANLADADLGSANLFGVHLMGARLVGARMNGANLSGAYLGGASLARVNLTQANLYAAHLIQTDLQMANLSHANLTQAYLFETNFTETICDGTVFAFCNLQPVLGLESVVHNGPSSIGIDTLKASFRGAGNRLTPELETFFRGAGVPRELLAGLPLLLAEVRYGNCFICYGSLDEAFAERLHNDLVAKGVSCWVYSMDATPGERTWREIGQKRREAEKMVVLCSAEALTQDGVKKEIEEQIDEDPDKIVLVSLDNLWKKPGFTVMRGNRDLKPFLSDDRNYADFANLPYEVALERLLKGLELKHEPQGTRHD